MNIKIRDPKTRIGWHLSALLIIAMAWVVAGDGHAQQTATTADTVLLDADELNDLVAPLALYPDDLVAIMLPASTYPLQLVEAERFLDSQDEDATPDPAWDDAIVALLNYPEALELLNDDLDWTWTLGEAVLAQQDQVLEAIETFRDAAFLAGNLESDEYQKVTREAERIIIEPADPEVIYVPYYDPVEVVVRRPYQTFFYHDRGYPIYYHPYAVGHRFYRDPFFWGVSTAFAISWQNRFLHLNYFDRIGHPFFGARFDNRRFFRHRSSIDYRVLGGTGRFNRRGNEYRWFPNRFHGSRPGYSRNRIGQRQLTYNRNGYTRSTAIGQRNRANVRNQRFSRNDRATNQRQRSAADNRQQRNRTANAAGQRQSAGNVTRSRRSDTAAASARTQRLSRSANRSGNTRRTEQSVEQRARQVGSLAANNRTTVKRSGQESRASRQPVRRSSNASAAPRSRMSAGTNRQSAARPQSTRQAAPARASRQTQARQPTARQSTPRATAPSRQAPKSRSAPARSEPKARARQSSSSRSSSNRSRASSSKSRSSSQRSRRRD